MERRLIFTGILAVSLLVPLAAAAQSLADVARAEEARRKTLKKGPVKVYGNDDLRPTVEPPPPPAATASAAAKPAPAATTSKPADGAKPGDAASAKPGEKPGTGAAAAVKPGDVKDEAYWRKRIADARTAVQRNQVFHDALQSQVNGLYAEFVNKSDPAQRALVEQKRLKALAEQDRIKVEITTQTKALQDIEDEARRAGVPAGWLR